MIGLRTFGLTLLVLAIAPFAKSQQVREYPVCDVGEIPFVGEVPNDPFIADFVIEAWKNLPGGAKSTIDTKDPMGNEIPATQGPQFQGIVARDGLGRVTIRRRWKIVPHNSQDGVTKASEAETWTEVVCDPVDGKRISLTGCPLSREGEFQNENSLLGAECDKGQAVTYSDKDRNIHTTSTFAAWHRTVKGRDNLGLEDFEGFPAYRYRMTESRIAHYLVNSDEMFVTLAFVTWLAYPDSELEQRLTEIRRSEPPSSLFKIPANVAFATVLDKKRD